MEPDDLLCSRNAHDKNVLVRRAQWKINQPPSLKKERASLEGTCISFDAREGQSGDSLEGKVGKSEGPAWGTGRSRRAITQMSMLTAETQRGTHAKIKRG